MAKKKTIRWQEMIGQPAVTVRRIRYEGNREQVTLLASTVGYFDFSDTTSRVFRAQPPENRRGRNGDYIYTSRNRVTLPDFTSLGDGAWKLHRWFSEQLTASRSIASVYFQLIRLECGGGGEILFDVRRESYDVARLITECALGILEPAEKRGWV